MVTRFVRRRMALGATTVAALVATTQALSVQQSELRSVAFTSGYILAGGVLFLALFQLRKLLSFLPLGRAAWWMQAHIYVGLSMCWVFALHVGMRWPTGIFESALFGTFVATSGSGLWGLWMTRAYPKRLSKLREDFVYERIPQLREGVRQQAGTLVMNLLRQQPAPTMGDFYSQRLACYFEQPRGLAYALRPSSRLRDQLRAEMDDLDRYHSADERAISDQLRRLIDRRDDLDYHEALQRHLKGWLFVHIGLTYALLMLSAIHIVLVHAFTGGGG